MKIIVDTNFILTCVKQKIDLFSQLEEIFPLPEIIIPFRVINELESLKKSREIKIQERGAADVSLQILRKKKPRLENLGENVDNSIVNYALKNKDVVVATLDRGIIRRLKSKAGLLTIRNRKRVALV
ncbi:hypothetical protein FJZ19_04840 [Candidatus Pacearchaeota archaeon]|nr:hypothetical protein [Candidatus Pacearchaeota archaeon]